jgi:hypothetical protein
MQNTPKVWSLPPIVLVASSVMDRRFITEALAAPYSPIAGPSRTISPSTDPEIEDVIADMTMTAVKECLTPTEAATVDANSLPTARKTTSDTDESILMPPPGPTYLQLRHHLSKHSPY